jgi:G:T-mismatch repair DNA endonuclease (very short patch repair protein)
VTISDIKKEAQRRGEKLITSIYIRSTNQLTFECPKGHQYTKSWMSYQIGRGCIKCNIFSNEYEISQFLNEHGIRHNLYNKTLLPGNELDVVIPEHKLAIEVCGVYYHSDKFLDKNYHMRKLLRCEGIGYKLLTIYTDEWKKYKNNIHNIILVNCGIKEQSIGTPTIKKLNKKEYIQFHNIYGVNRLKNGTYYGICNNEELITAVTVNINTQVIINNVITKGILFHDWLNILATFLNNTYKREVFVNHNRRFIFNYSGFEVYSILLPESESIDKNNNFRVDEKDVKVGKLKIYDCGIIKYKHNAAIC